MILQHRNGRGCPERFAVKTEEGGVRTAFLYVASENGSLAEECSVMPCASGLFVEIDGETIFKVETGDDCAKLVLVGK